MSQDQTPNAAGAGHITRRDMLRRSAVVGGALAAAVPIVQTIRVPDVWAVVPGTPITKEDCCNGDGTDKLRAATYTYYSGSSSPVDIDVEIAVPGSRKGEFLGSFSDIDSGEAITVDLSDNCVGGSPINEILLKVFYPSDAAIDFNSSEMPEVVLASQTEPLGVDGDDDGAPVDPSANESTSTPSSEGAGDEDPEAGGDGGPVEENEPAEDRMLEEAPQSLDQESLEPELICSVQVHTSCSPSTPEVEEPTSSGGCTFTASTYECCD